MYSLKSSSLFCIALLVLSFFSCKNKDETATLGVSSNEITFTVDGGVLEIVVSCDANWTISHGNASWLTITKESGKIIIQALPNDTPDERSSNITVTVAGENVNQNVDVKQSGVKGQIPVSGSSGGRQYWSFTYDEQNRLIKQELLGTTRLSYDASGEIKRVVEINRIWFYNTDSIVYEYRKTGKTIVCNIKEYEDNKVVAAYVETITLNAKDLIERIDRPNSLEYRIFTYDGTGNVLSFDTYSEEGNLRYRETFTYDSKKGLFSSVNTGKWWFARDKMNWVFNNILTDHEENGFFESYSYTYDACGYPKTFSTDGDVMDFEYKRF